jgi:hypothetical protein
MENRKMFSRKCLAATGVLAGLASLGAQQALALSPSQPIAARVYVGGATAQDPGFLLIARSVCQSVAIDNTNATTRAASDATRMDAYLGTDNQVYTCKSNAELSPEVPVGTNIAIYKTSVGGSGTGVIPIARQITSYGTPTINVVYFPTTLTALPNSGDCTIAGGASAVVEPVTVGAKTAARYLVHTLCGAGNFAKVPEIGISDVEPAFIDGSTPNDQLELTTTAVNHSIFTWSVSEPLRNALQAAQGLVACTVARDDASRELVANQPNLTRAQVAAIMSGNITNWNQISRPGTNQGLYDYITTQSTVGCPRPTALAGEGGARSFVIRRVPSSGTQAITEIWTLKQRCEAGVAQFLGDSDPAGNGSSAIPTFDPTNYVQEYSSSSGVRNGLDKASGPWSKQASPLAEFRWAIGLLSCENTFNGQSPAEDRSYRPIKLDNAFPGMIDTINSAYSFYAEQVVNTSNDVPPPAGLPAKFSAYMALNLADRDVLRVVNEGLFFPGTTRLGVPLLGDHATTQGRGCLLAVPDGATLLPPAQPLTAAAVNGSPVNSSWKRPLGTTNNCQDPVTLGVFPGVQTPAGGKN